MYGCHWIGGLCKRGWRLMSGQHTDNHNDHFAFVGALEQNHHFESLVERRNHMMSTRIDAVVPWKQYHRANIPHGKRQSNG